MPTATYARKTKSCFFFFFFFLAKLGDIYAWIVQLSAIRTGYIESSGALLKNLEASRRVGRVDGGEGRLGLGLGLGLGPVILAIGNARSGAISGERNAV